jgi:signal peptidase II
VKASDFALVFSSVSFITVLVVTAVISHFSLPLEGMRIIPGFADFSFVQNRGVSFGLLSQNSNLGEKYLTIGTALLTVALGVWAYRATRVLLGIALGILIGGALYNTADRALHGGVFDFLSVHLGTIPLFVCNVADIAISVGGILVLLDSIKETPLSASSQ